MREDDDCPNRSNGKSDIIVELQGTSFGTIGYKLIDHTFVRRLRKRNAAQCLQKQAESTRNRQWSVAEVLAAVVIGKSESNTQG